MSGDAGFPFESRIAERAAACGIALTPGRVGALAAHAREVLAADPRLHLTSIVEPEAFVERHLGEAFEGAALLEEDVRGTLLDLGSGNGYPGLPLAASRPGLRPVLAEVSGRKAGFLRALIERTGLPGAIVLDRQVQREADIAELGPVRVLATRAMGGWERIVPRLAGALSDDGGVLLWAGEGTEAILRRQTWRRFDLVARRALPGRERSWVWLLRAAQSSRSKRS